MTSRLIDSAVDRLTTLRRRFAPPPEVAVLTPEDEEATQRLITGETEARDRSAALSLLGAAADRPADVLPNLPAHSVSLIRERHMSRVWVDAVDRAMPSGADADLLSRQASLHVQIRDWDAALALYHRVRARRPLTALERFIVFQIASVDRRRGLLSRIDSRALATITARFPEAAADVAARHLVFGRQRAFAAEIEGLTDREVEGAALARLSHRLAALSVGDVPHGAPEPGEDLSRVIAVCGLRCSGGGAVQDFLEDHAGVRASAGEYVALSGHMGIRPAMMSAHPAVRAIEFARQHLFGLTVPISRTHARVLRQARADRADGLTPALVEALETASRAGSVRGLLHHLPTALWRAYLAADPRALLLKKPFPIRRMELFPLMPPVRCLLVWRDPRDQYADQVARGFCPPGDVQHFIAKFEARMAALRGGLAAAGPRHRELWIDVGFEAFVGSESYRDDLRRRLGLDPDGHVPTRFVAQQSAANVGIWRDRCSPAEIAAIERRLRPYLDSAAVSVRERFA